MMRSSNNNVPSVDMSDYERQGCLHEMFTMQARKTPDATAVVTYAGQKVTFAELERMTDVLSTALRHMGVRRNRVVGIYMERSLEFVVCYIGILKAGGAYLPIEVSYPLPLLQSVLDDAQPVAICTKKYLLEKLEGRKNVLTLEGDWLKKLSSENAPFPEPANVSLDDMAYTVYSSGTTGKPKGIQCPHRGAVFSYHWRHLSFPYQSDDREACNVFFVWEFMRPLIKGVPMYIIPDDVIYDPAQLCEFLQQHRITRMLFTPSLLEAVLETRSLDLKAAFHTMRQIWFCGEVVTTSLRERVRNVLPWVRFLNLYSVSECHDIACSDLTEIRLNPKDKFCPVGQLLPGVQIFIMDSDLNVQPIGLPGEIYVGGPTLAMGYLNRPELNSERFVAPPAGISVVSSNNKLYRTGDWGYLRSDGSLEICGRCDSMVKIRGYSIEVQAVEAALLELHDMVQTGCVVVAGDEGTDKILVAYIVPNGGISRKEVRAALKKRLPFYMIPAKFVFLDNIPILESSGKLDKKSLPQVRVENVDIVDPEDLPSTETEKKLASIWSDILNLKTIDVHESFFDLGGHSLLASRLLRHVSDEWNRTMTVADLFDRPTLAEMAEFLDGKAANEPGIYSTTKKLNLMSEVDTHDQGVVSIDMSLRAFWRSIQLANNNKWNTGKVLLTGATGFLGCFLLQELLKNTKMTVYCVVRVYPGMELGDRIHKTLQQYGAFNEGDLEKQLQNRCVPIKGDVSLINLGMNDDDYTYLSYEVDCVIHAAAAVNLVYPYAALYGANVLGTSNVLLFALNHKIKPIHYVSTDAVFPHGLQNCTEDVDMTQYADQLQDGYAQSKWVAEQLILRAKARGLPVTVYRCGNISGSQEGAYWNPADFTLLMLQACIRLGAAPDLDWQIELTPVDFISNFIVRMTQNISQSLGKIFHLTNNNTMDCRLLWQLLKVEGYHLSIVSYEEWYSKVQSRAMEAHNSEESELLKLLDNTVKDASYFSQLSTFKQRNVMPVLEVHNLQYPSVSVNLVRAYGKQLAKRGIVPRPQRRPGEQGILLRASTSDVGRVAIVTGASSGIGHCIAEHLALTGIRVALVARRVGRLKELQKTIEDAGGVAVSIQTDVTKHDQVSSMVSQVESLLGPVDILVNNAGVMYVTPFDDVNYSEWDAMVDVNVKGLLCCTAVVVPLMIQRKKGHVINISSDGGRRPFKTLSVYVGTKYFVQGFSDSMRLDLADTGIKVTCIQPGDVATELLQREGDEKAKQYAESLTFKILESRDVAEAVLYAIAQPDYCAVNEILLEPRAAPV